MPNAYPSPLRFQKFEAKLEPVVVALYKAETLNSICCGRCHFAAELQDTLSTSNHPCLVGFGRTPPSIPVASGPSGIGNPTQAAGHPLIKPTWPTRAAPLSKTTSYLSCEVLKTLESILCYRWYGFEAGSCVCRDWSGEPSIRKTRASCSKPLRNFSTICSHPAESWLHPKLRLSLPKRSARVSLTPP